MTPYHLIFFFAPRDFVEFCVAGIIMIVLFLTCVVLYLMESDYPYYSDDDEC